MSSSFTQVLVYFLDGQGLKPEVRRLARASLEVGVCRRVSNLGAETPPVGCKWMFLSESTLVFRGTPEGLKPFELGAETPSVGCQWRFLLESTLVFRGTRQGLKPFRSASVRLG